MSKKRTKSETLTIDIPFEYLKNAARAEDFYGCLVTLDPRSRKASVTHFQCGPTIAAQLHDAVLTNRLGLAKDETTQTETPSA